MIIKIFLTINIALSLLLSASFGQTLPWLKVSGESFVNDQNEVVFLRGLNLSNNVWGNWVTGFSEKAERQGSDPLVRPQAQANWVLQDKDFELIAQLKPNVIRYAINSELFKPSNPYQQLNLKQLLKDIKRFNADNIYVIINLHLPEGLDVQNDNYEREKPPQERIASIFENKEYWKNTIALWQYLANNLKSLSGVAGYELFNEPRLPSKKAGGLKEFQHKYNELSAAIRAVDQQHIIFLPEYNSLELDDKFETIRWERGFIKADSKLKNIAYVFHFYEPFEYTHLGAKNFNQSILVTALEAKIEAATKLGCLPLVVSEYGVNQYQPLEKRLEYLAFLHKQFKKHGLSSMLWEYKSKVGAFVKHYSIFGLFGHYPEADSEINNGEFVSWAGEAAATNSFDYLFKKYFWQQKRIAPISLMDNRLIWLNLHDYFLVN